MAYMTLENKEIQKIIKDWLVNHKRATDFLGTTNPDEMKLFFRVTKRSEPYIHVEKIEE